MQIPDEIRRDILEWCQYHFENNLVGLAFFDPTQVDPSYPKGEINVLVAVHLAPEETRERYDLISEMLIKNLAAGHSLTCRVQTAGELSMLSTLQLPLIEIYLRHAEIIYDPQQILAAMQKTLP